MNTRIRASLTLAIALIATACDTGDDYNEYGQLVEKTDVRVTGVDFAAARDSEGRLWDETDTFAPTDTVYASVRTKGSSSKTVLGVRWRRPNGDEFVMDNKVIRPTGDTSTLFTLNHLVALEPGSYALEMRVNGKVVKTAHFTVSNTAERHVASSRPVSAEGKLRLDAIRPLFRKKFAELTTAATNLFEREPKDQSPFEWRGLRAGMSFSKLDRLTRPAAAWNCAPMFLTALGLKRDIALESEHFSGGHVVAIVDTVGQRVVDVQYSISWMPKDSAPRLSFERELIALAARWDGVPGVIRRPREVHDGPSFASWDTPDSLWSGKIFYNQSHGVARPDGFRIEETHWGDRLMSEIPDSVQGQMHNPESPYYRNQKPDGGCSEFLKSSKQF